jgi:CBS domain-containing protein
MSILAKDVMTKKVITVKEDMKVFDLIEIINENKISGTPVLDKDGKLIGIVTKSDILGTFLDFDIDLNLKIDLKGIMEFARDKSVGTIVSETEVEVKDIMTPNPITAEEDTSIEKLAEIMIDNRIHRIIIIKDESIIGIISPLNLLYHVAGRIKDE